MRFRFTAPLWEWSAQGGWFFVTLPDEYAEDIREVPRMPRGFGAWRRSMGSSNGSHSVASSRSGSRGRRVGAARLLRIMNMGYSRALGVTCVHCHTETDFASDDKRPKRAAREMAVMHRAINEQLKEMKNLEAEGNARSINCNTCHRGQVSPIASTR